MTPVANYLVWTPLGVDLTYSYIFAFKFTLRSPQPYIVPIICHRFATGVVDTGGKLPPVPLSPAANLPPVSLIPMVHLDLGLQMFEKI